MLLYFDLDDVVVRFVEPWLDAINAASGESLTKADMTDWEISRFTRLGKGAYQFISEPWLHRRVKLYPGAARSLARLLDAGHEVYICTAAGPGSADAKMDWVDQHLPWLGYRRLWIGHDKHLLARPGVVLTDDKPANIRDWRAAGGIGVVFDQPWNQDVTGSRVRSWPELERWMAQHARREATA